MSVCCECCVLSGSGLCDELITRPEEFYRLWCVVVCDLENSRMRRPGPSLGRSAIGKNYQYCMLFVWLCSLIYPVCKAHAPYYFVICGLSAYTVFLQMALQPGVGLGLRYNMPPGLSVPCSASQFVYTHLSQVHGHVIQPSHSWSSSSSRCVQLSVQHLF